MPDSSKRWLGLLLAAGSAGAGLWLVWHYPLQPGLACLLWLAVAALGFAHWQALPLMIPGLVPVLGFAPWTGWVTFEELDLLVLAVAAGGYAALALGAKRGVELAPAWRRPLAWSGLSKLLLTLFCASLLLAIWRGFEQAGGWQFGWWQGYHEPMNSLRQGKSLWLVLLLLPLWRAAGAGEPAAVQRWFGLAMLLALGGASLAVLWERLAYTGLLNFSSEYRSTGLFWEMHVGGAALDGCLALGLPFALLWVLRERRPWAFAAALGLLLLAGYAALTTFSRGVYLGLPLGAGLCSLLLARQRRAERAAALAAAWPRRGLALAVLLAFGMAAWPVFQAGGYRALLALAGSALLMMVMPPLRLRQTRGQQLLVLLLALLAAALAGGVSWLLAQAVPKSAYVVDALVVLGGLWLAWWLRAGLPRNLSICLMAGAWFWSLACVVVVAGNWGGETVLQRALLPVLGLALAWTGLQLLPGPAAGLLPALSWRAKSLLWTGCLMLFTVVAALAGGAYVSDRMATGQRDLEGRFQHWRLARSLLETPQDWLLGKGVGRFASSFMFVGPAAEQVGDYRLVESAQPPNLLLTSGKHVLGWGELFRVSQRIAAPRGEMQMTLKLRSASDVNLHLEVCEKHLLYNAVCVVKNLPVQSQGGGWQTLQAPLGQAPSLGGRWWAPRFVVFSVALGSPASAVEIAELSLRDAAEPALLTNSDFSRGMAYWFFSSDRHQLPWHIKSLGLHLLFEQGLLGLALGVSLVVAVLWRCSFGHARFHALAPAVVSALLGFLIVGLFESLIDAPRVAFLFYALLLLGLGLRSTRAPLSPSMK
ncbi:hypothetical protein OOZ63_01310 [Paucibacter sp. PLA-PC-4]|uniref:hypothetical protein n=1 Tax=Paucibacter sp. PLA-PC-4 TaxID=2993655 RepID=UPI00224971F3|nr:hypothetical protein [Paucibacter sp. PLA-PC-4]MCX2860476.1 hypothetical protein [Paucibacter sp. PLA-PC-4]